MILSSRPEEDMGHFDGVIITLVEDTSVDPAMTSIEVHGRVVSIRRQDEGFTLFDFAKLMAELDIPFMYEELK